MMVANNGTTPGSARKLKPRAQVNRAKAALLADSKPTRDHPIAEMIREHPVPAVGLAAALGFLIVVLKPGRAIMRQVTLMGGGILLRKALFKYLANH